MRRADGSTLGASEPLVAANGALEVWLIVIVFDEPIVETLMVAFEVVVFGELVNRVAEMALAYRNNLAEAL